MEQQRHPRLDLLPGERQRHRPDDAQGREVPGAGRRCAVLDDKAGLRRARRRVRRDPLRTSAGPGHCCLWPTLVYNTTALREQW